MHCEFARCFHALRKKRRTSGCSILCAGSASSNTGALQIQTVPPPTGKVNNTAVAVGRQCAWQPMTDCDCLLFIAYDPHLIPHTRVHVRTHRLRHTHTQAHTCGAKVGREAVCSAHAKLAPAPQKKKKKNSFICWLFHAAIEVGCAGACVWSHSHKHRFT